MAELELKGLHADGEHLVLLGPDGHRHRLVIDDALRAAVRHDRPRLEQVRAAGDLRPREIQSRLRAGERPEDIAADAGVPVENVRRYESPVAAEQAWIVHQARAMTLGRDHDSPVLGDLVVDRLASRGVEPADLDWNAVRRPGEGWEVVLHFRAGDRDRTARWSVDVPNRVLRALDDEGRWLSETELGAPEGRHHLASVHGSRVYDVEVDAVTADVAAVEVGRDHPAARHPAAQDRPAGDVAEVDVRTDDILAGLRASRGVRQEIVALPEDDERWGDPPPAHPPASAPHERPDASVLPLRAAAPSGAEAEPEHGEAPVVSSAPAAPPAAPRNAAPSAEPTRRSKSRSRRTSVPSWDEIVFGAKPE